MNGEVKEKYLQVIKGKKIKSVIYGQDKDSSDLVIYFTDNTKLYIDTLFNCSGMNFDYREEN